MVTLIHQGNFNPAAAQNGNQTLVTEVSDTTTVPSTP